MLKKVDKNFRSAHEDQSHVDYSAAPVAEADAVLDSHADPENFSWRISDYRRSANDGSFETFKARFERGLDRALPETAKPTPQMPALPEVAHTIIEVSIHLSSFNGSRRKEASALRDMLDTGLARFQAQQVDSDRNLYRISVPTPSADILDDHLYALLDELHRIADAKECFLEAVCRDPASGRHWD